MLANDYRDLAREKECHDFEVRVFGSGNNDIGSGNGGECTHGNYLGCATEKDGIANGNDAQASGNDSVSRSIYKMEQARGNDPRAQIASGVFQLHLERKVSMLSLPKTLTDPLDRTQGAGWVLAHRWLTRLGLHAPATWMPA